MQRFVPYPPVGRHGVIGDRRTAALVAADGTLDWLCLRDYDDDPVFASLVDARRGGWWRMGPSRPAFGSQEYLDDTAVLRTTWSVDGGALELTDAMPWPDEKRRDVDEPRRIVLRRLRCLDGAAECTIDFAPRDMLVPDLQLEPARDGLVVSFFGRADLRAVGVSSTHALHVAPDGGSASAHFRLRAGESAWMVLAVSEPPSRWPVGAAEDALEATVRSWRGWVARFDTGGDHARSLRRSLLTLHLLGYAPSGSMVAAPTLGLPERVGGCRNYDYRHAWVRDASLSVLGLSLHGDTDTAERYLAWLARLPSSTDAPLQVAYDVHGRTRIKQRRWRGAAGYRQSRPVLLGNRAYRQRQTGCLGYMAECMSVGLEEGIRWCPEYSSLLARVARHVCRTWPEPDSGHWELQKREQFVASKVMCWVVLDRAVKIAARVGGFDSDDVAAWRRAADDVRAAVLACGYDAELGAFTQRFGHASVDAATLLVPITGFLPGDDPRVTSTLDRIEERLGFDRCVYRFVPKESVGEEPLAVGEFEGAFVPCTFWMASARAMAGDVDRAESIVDRLERTAGDLGLFAEEIDPRGGEWLGNYPLLFSHVEHLRALLAIEHARR